jgi:uncharacterized protein with HEPN domain
VTKNYLVYIQDILDAITSIENFVAGLDYETFKNDDKTSSAVIRKFEIIGEAAKHIPEEIRKQYPSISWKEMAGMRDRLIHLYSGVDYQLVWGTVKKQLPEIKLEIQNILYKP